MRLPGDKSLAIRAALLASLADAPWHVTNFPDGDDVQHALDAARALGAAVSLQGARVSFVPAHAPPSHVSFSAGGSATLLRLTSGLVCTRAVDARIRMNAQLKARPHAATLALLADLVGPGAHIDGDALVVRGRVESGARERTVRTPSASAQLKGLALLAALGLRGSVTVQEARPTRPHTEQMLAGLGAPIRIAEGSVALDGPFRPGGCALKLPGDPSTAALLAVAVAGAAAVRFDDVCVTPLRFGFFDALRAMGASVSLEGVVDGPVGRRASVAVRGAALRGIDVAADAVPALLDEVPALACVCAQASGPSRLRGLGALRGKESDRVSATAALVREFGVTAHVDGDDLVIDGRPAAFVGRPHVQTAGDHRIAMAALALARAAGVDVVLDDPTCVGKSMPTFAAALDACIDARTDARTDARVDARSHTSGDAGLDGPGAKK